MSRFTTTGKRKNTKYVYGFDRMLSYYFLDSVSPSGNFQHLVGLMSPIYGSAHNLLEMCDRRGIALPPQHREELLLDLPLSELNDEVLATPEGDCA